LVREASGPRITLAFQYLTSIGPIPDELPALDLTIDAGIIPRCAMEVWRDKAQRLPLLQADGSLPPIP
jgi:hypothetical protein